MHKQHDAELLASIRTMSAHELGETLEGLGLEQRACSGSVFRPSASTTCCGSSRTSGARPWRPGASPSSRAAGSTCSELVEGRLRQLPVAAKRDLYGVRPIWVDLVNASKAERSWIAAHFQVELPDPLDVSDLEVSARFHIGRGRRLPPALELPARPRRRLAQRAGRLRAAPRHPVHAARRELPVFRLQMPGPDPARLRDRCGRRAARPLRLGRRMLGRLAREQLRHAGPRPASWCSTSR